MLSGDRAIAWSAGSIGLSLISRIRKDGEPPTTRWHRLYGGLAPDEDWAGAQLVSLGVLSPALGEDCIVIATLCAPAPASGSTGAGDKFGRLQQCLGDLCDALGKVAAQHIDASAQSDDGATHKPPTLGQRLDDARAAYTVFAADTGAPGRIPAMLASSAAIRAWTFDAIAALLDSAEQSNTLDNGAN